MVGDDALWGNCISVKCFSCTYQQRVGKFSVVGVSNVWTNVGGASPSIYSSVAAHWGIIMIS